MRSVTKRVLASCSTQQLLAISWVVSTVGLHATATTVDEPEAETLALPYGAMVLWCTCVWLRVSFLEPSAEGYGLRPLWSFCSRAPKLNHYCRSCGKEVRGFDHHCVFLNTCVGDGNYASFLALVASLATLEVAHVVYAVLNLVRRLRILFLASSLASGLVASLFVGLLAFHAYVRIWLGTSTYGWILNRRCMEAGDSDADERRERREQNRQVEYDHWLAEQASKRSSTSPGPSGHVELTVRNILSGGDDESCSRRRASTSTPAHSPRSDDSNSDEDGDTADERSLV